MRLPFPLTAGTDHVSYNLIKSVAEKHDVTLISHSRSEGSEAIEGLNRFGVKTILVDFPALNGLLMKTFNRLKREFLLFFCLIPREVTDNTSKSIEKVIKRKLKEEEFDLVQIEYWFAGKYRKYIKKSLSSLIVHDAFFITAEQNVKFQKGLKSKIVGFIEYLSIKRYELKIIKSFDHVLFISKHDAEIFKKYIPGLNSAKILPLGFNYPVWDENEKEIENNTLIFVGSMMAYFNVDAMLYFCNDVLPSIEKEVPEVKLYIVGENPQNEIKSLASRGNIIVTGSVTDVKDFIKMSEVYVAPLRIGTGIKTKIIEAMACAKAIVTTSVGVQGLEFENGENIIVADDPADFANNVIELLRNPLKRKKLSENARKLFYQHYHLTSVKSKIQDVYSSLISE